MSEIRKLKGRTLFLDANAVIYFLEGMTSKKADEIFELASHPNPSIMFVTHTGIIDEILFKILVLRAKFRGYKKNTVSKLRADKRIVMEIAPELENVKKFLDILAIRIEPLRKEDVYQVIPIMAKYGLFEKDALTLKAMKKFNMKFLFSSDRDFDKVSWIERIDPLK